MAIGTLDGHLKMELQISAQQSLTGTDYSPLSNNSTITKKADFGTDAANAAAEGADQVISFVQSVAAGGNTTIDLQAVTNILQQSAQSFTRIKQLLFRLLSVADDATNGTNASSVSIGNGGANGTSLFMGNSAQTFTIPNGGAVGYLGNQTAGLGVNATTKDLFILNNDGAVIAKVQVSVVGGST